MALVDSCKHCCAAPLHGSLEPTALTAMVWCGAGVPKSLFGFEGTKLVGQPLSSIIDVFSDWKAGCGEDMSLLELLVGQALAASGEALCNTSTAPSCTCVSWRVGLHRPVLDAGHTADEVG